MGLYDGETLLESLYELDVMLPLSRPEHVTIQPVVSDLLRVVCNTVLVAALGSRL